jgi:glycosyltransferase involved in cell wall biosynthesis
MTERMPRVIGTLIGDIKREPSARTKYGFFWQAVERRFPLVGVYDASLHGFDRLVNALRTVHPDRRQWRERFYKNVVAFRLRSRRLASRLEPLQAQADVILQVGVLFDACWDNITLPSVVYTDYTAWLAAQIPQVGRSPFTLEQRQEWLDLEHRTFERAAYICTRSKLVRDSIVHDYNIPPERVTVVGGGINFALLPEPVFRSEADPPTALFIGKELYRKGGDILLKAFARVRQEIPDARLFLLTHERIPAGLPLDGVELITPTWEREAIASLYRRSDVFVLPSRLETWGDVILEAMSYGLPCIGVTGQAMEEIIENERTGLVVPPEDTAALATALTRLLRNSGVRKELGCRARQRARAKYTWDRVVECVGPAIKAAANLGSQSS